jgi:hypothetical protein
METVTIEVTKKHFDTAQALALKGRGGTENCLVAQAFKAAFPRKHVSVGYCEATVGTGTKARRFDLPRRAQNLIGRFDASAGAYDPTKGELARAKRLRNALPVTFTATLQSEV